MKTINVVAGIIKKDNKIFIAERGYGECIHYYQSRNGFYEGVLEGKKVVVVQSGIGKGKCRYVHPDPGRSLSGGSGDQYRYRRKP